MLKIAALGCLAALATSVGADQAPEPSSPSKVGGCPPEPADVVVEVLRFDAGVLSYAFRVTNNDEGAIHSLAIGEDVGQLPPLIVPPDTVPTSIRAPSGWRGVHVFGQDWRKPGRHWTPAVSYVWIAEDEEARIQPGESLSGFSLLLPAPTRPDPAELGRGHSDLTKVSLLTDSGGVGCPGLGTVRLDSSRSGKPQKGRHY